MLSQRLKYCPADTRLSITNPSYGDRPLPSYKFVRYQPPQSNVSYWRITQFKNLSEKLLMCDSNSENNFGDLVGIIRKDGPQSGLFDQLVNKGAPAAPRSTGWDTEKELMDRHGGTGAVLFLDSHVGVHTWKEYVANIPSGTANDPLDAGRKWTRLGD
jgi:prepilin-type processing-associated H-X9-DG protein